MKQRPQYVLEALARAGHDVWFVDPRLSHPERRDPRIRLVPSLRETPRSDVIIYTHFAPTRILIDRYDNAGVAYDILDDLTIYDPDELGMPAERRVRTHHGPLMERADVVIASSAVLAAKHRAERDDLILVENGVDIELFTPDTRHKREGSPILGYHGAIAPWFDFELVYELARSRPQYTVSLVGPVRPEVLDDFSRLVSLPNLHHLGEQSAEKTAELVRGFDVGLIPFVVGEMTAGVSPLKMYEYLASGVPVVATPLPACVDHPLVATADDLEEMIRMVDRAVGLPDRERAVLRQGGEHASWDRRVLPLLERLEALGIRQVGSD